LGDICSSNSDCISDVCSTGGGAWEFRCCGTKGQSIGCIACDSSGDCWACNAGYYKTSGQCYKCSSGKTSPLGSISSSACVDPRLINQENWIDSINLNGAESVTISPDGKNVYAVAETSSSIVYWNRDSTTGALANQVNLIDNNNLYGATGVAVSPDNKHVYAVSRGANSIVHWDRDSTGALTNQVNLISAWLYGVRSVTISPDNKHIYAVNFLGNSIVHWDRDLTTGVLINIVINVDITNIN
jgi:DNA-binding beta-propeller fold protein YncE